jgi:hypothetical protein
MRYTPMNMQEACNLEADMLDHFKLLPDNWKVATKYVPTSVLRTTKQLPKRAVKALSISQAFIELANDEADPPIDVNEMTLAIRYKMGYGFWAWFLFKNFAIPIIKWLWAKYHK